MYDSIMRCDREVQCSAVKCSAVCMQYVFRRRLEGGYMEYIFRDLNWKGSNLSYLGPPRRGGGHNALYMHSL